MMNQTSGSFKITVQIQRRRDGGVRVWSDQVPGLVLSSKDEEKVLADVKPALEAILSEMMGCEVKAERLDTFEAPATPHGRKPRIQKSAPERPRFNIFKRLEFAASPCPAY